jgi:hypothetical protein
MGVEFTRALQGLGQTFGEIAQQTAARKRQALLDARQAEQDKLAMRYQQAQIGNIDRDNARLDAEAATEQATKAANTSRMQELNPILGEYPILRGAPSGEGRYSQLSDTIKPQIDSSAFGITPKTGMGAPTAENPYDISKFGKQATGAIEISPALASMRSEDLRKSQIAGMSPQQLKFRTGIAGSSLPADINAAKNLDDLQKYEDETLKTGKADERYEREFGLKEKEFAQKQQSAYLDEQYKLAQIDKMKADAAKTKSDKFTEGQTNSATFAVRMELAEDVLNQLDRAGFDPASFKNQIMQPDGKGLSAIKDPAQRRYAQAMRNFVTAQLRKESGAAISEGEFNTAYAQYFAQPFDDKTTLAQKADNRRAAMAGQRVAAGPAYEPTRATYDSMTEKVRGGGKDKSALDAIWGN